MPPAIANRKANALYMVKCTYRKQMNLLYHHQQAYLGFYHLKTLIWCDKYYQLSNASPCWTVYLCGSRPQSVLGLGGWPVQTVSMGFLLHTAFSSVVSGSSAHILVNHSFIIKFTSKLSVHLYLSYTIISPSYILKQSNSIRI